MCRSRITGSHIRFGSGLHGDFLKVELITFSDSEINFLPQLSKYLSSKIANLAISETALASLLDLPKKLSSLKGADLIFVSVFYANESAGLKIALEKLVDFEISSGKKIVKAIEKIDPDDFDESEEDLSKKYGVIIAKKLIGVSLI